MRSLIAKCLVPELAPPHAQSAWGSRGEKVRAVGLICLHSFVWCKTPTFIGFEMRSLIAKDLVAELTPPYAQSAWGSRGERVRVAGLAVCCNYFSKKKKEK